MPNQPKLPTREKGTDKRKDKEDVLNPENKGDEGKGKMKMNLISHDQIEKSLHEGSACYALVVDRKIEVQTPQHIKPILKEFSEILPQDLSGELPPLPCETSNMLLI